MGKIYNGIMGLVVGDALGVPFEFHKRDSFLCRRMTGHGTYNQKPGTWSDDSSMTLATLHSISLLETVEPMDIMERFSMWLFNKEYTPRGEVFDVGGCTRRAIARYCRGHDPLHCGGKTRMDNGNGALMRILPIAMTKDKGDKETVIRDVAHLTHAHFISDFACFVYSAIVENLMDGADKEKAVQLAVQRYQNQIESVSMLGEYRRLYKIHELKRDEIKSSGYVVDTLEAAIWCFATTNSYKGCVLTAVNLGEDTDTVAAVAGGLAGIYYGCGGKTGIPETWINQICRRDWIKEVCNAVEALDF